MTQQDIINGATWVLDDWHRVVGYSLIALAISIGLQYFKKRYHWDEIQAFKLLKLIPLDGPRIVALIYSACTALTALYFWVINPESATVIPAQFSFLLSAGFYIHRFIVSPTGQRVEKALQPYWKALEQIRAAETTQSVTSAAIPLISPIIAPVPTLDPLGPQPPQTAVK